MYDRNDLTGLIKDYEADVLIAKSLEKQAKSAEEKEATKVRKVCDLLSRFQCSKARKHATSNGLGDICNANIVQQMQRKHPGRKKEIVPLTPDELDAKQKGN